MNRACSVVLLALLGACSSPPRVIELLVPARRAQLECRRLVSFNWHEESTLGEPVLIGNALYVVEKGAYLDEENGSTCRVWRVDLETPQTEPRLVFSCPGYANRPLIVTERDGRPIVVLTYPNMKEGAKGELETLYLRNRAQGSMWDLQVAYPYFAYLESDWFGPFSHGGHMNVIVGLWESGTPRELFGRSYVEDQTLSLVLLERDALVAFRDARKLKLAHVERTGVTTISTLDTGDFTEVYLIKCRGRIIPVYVKNYRQLMIGSLLEEPWLSLNAGLVSATSDGERLTILRHADDYSLLSRDSQQGWTEFTIQGEIPRRPKLVCDAKGALLIGRIKDGSVAVCRLEPTER